VDRLTIIQRDCVAMAVIYVIKYVYVKLCSMIRSFKGRKKVLDNVTLFCGIGFNSFYTDMLYKISLCLKITVSKNIICQS